ncbi:MAG: hypothetical protein PHE49_10930 [bacterium]|nr:hypothetical protein [bacterium]
MNRLKFFYILVLTIFFSSVSYGFGKIEVVNFWWTPTDAGRGKPARKFITVTNTGTECIDSFQLKVSLAGYGFWLGWCDCYTDSFVFLCPGDTVAFGFKETHDFNERLSDWLPQYDPLYTIHYTNCSNRERYPL